MTDDTMDRMRSVAADIRRDHYVFDLPHESISEEPMSQPGIMEPGTVMGCTRAAQPRKASVWMACPTKRPPEESEPIFRKWKERGYRLALWCDEHPGHDMADIRHINLSPYPGYAVAQNYLIRRIFAVEDCDWVVAAADDLEPDANHTAEEIARECSEYFSDPHYNRWMDGERKWDASTFGVMQATGDDWGMGHAGGGPNKAYADMVAGSPWIGREFAGRVYGGRGPYWPEYSHMYCDNELRAVAMKLGCYWERRDLIHFHNHWGRPRDGEVMGLRSRMPAFLEEANSPVSWDRYKRLFEAREKLGFPGSEVIE